MTNMKAVEFNIEPLPQVITFDCYGTLVQWHEVLLAEIVAVLARQPVKNSSASAILDSFSAQSRRLTAETPHRSYFDILRAGFTVAFGEHGVSVNTMEIDRIASSPTRMGPHPEVPDALRRLKRR